MDPNSEEALSFDKRISERIDAGFIPDIRRARKCEFFYKSFWRDPHFINLYLQKQVDFYLKSLEKNSYPHARILDAGCGAGYIALELARNGYNVVGIDISEKSVETAKKTLEENPYTDSFGSLVYMNASIFEIDEKFDAIIFSGVLHHIEDADAAIQVAYGALNPGGIIICREPCHELWRKEDAAITAIIRLLLSCSGNWYEENLVTRMDNKFENMALYVNEIFDEYYYERDTNEAMQSPNDNVTRGTDIIETLTKKFRTLDIRPSSSFIYRVLGGLRGKDEDIYRIADLLYLYEETLLRETIIRPNYKFYVGLKE